MNDIEEPVACASVRWLTADVGAKVAVMEGPPVVGRAEVSAVL
ncbi:hypothetical protein [Lentzea tibetensis]|nr:hypothetical protein [Lentzea tibetensis]